MRAEQEPIWGGLTAGALVARLVAAVVAGGAVGAVIALPDRSLDSVASTAAVVLAAGTAVFVVGIARRDASLRDAELLAVERMRIVAEDVAVDVTPDELAELHEKVDRLASELARRGEPSASEAQLRTLIALSLLREELREQVATDGDEAPSGRQARHQRPRPAV
jgi:hypothetical protein